MTKVFISQPMAGYGKEEIIAIRKEAMNGLSGLLKGELFFIPSYFTDAELGSERDAIRLLAKSIDLLADADVAYFCEGWQESRGCNIEHDVAEYYGITIIEG